MIDLYEEEYEKVLTLTWKLHEKYGNAWTDSKLEEFKKEATAAFYQLGLVVQVNLIPPYNGEGGPEVNIVERVTPILDFDHEKKAWEIKKSREQGKR